MKVDAVLFPMPNVTGKAMDDWRRELVSDGLPEDRFIRLRGEAISGTIPFVVMVVRVDPIRLGPDFHQDLDVSVYRDYLPSTLVDVVSELIDIGDAPTV